LIKKIDFTEVWTESGEESGKAGSQGGEPRGTSLRILDLSKSVNV